MTRTGAILLLLTILAGCKNGQESSTGAGSKPSNTEVNSEGSVVGRYRYDTARMTITLDPASQERLNALGDKGKQELEKQKKGLAEMLDTMTLEFMKEGTFQVSSAKMAGETVGGKWNLKGSTLTADPDAPGQKTLDLVVSKGGQVLTMKESTPGFGSMTIDLVKQDP